MAAKLSCLVLSLAGAVLDTHHAAHAFTLPSSAHVVHPVRTSARTDLYMESSFFADATAPKAVEAKVQVDGNDRVFTEGASVAVAPNRSIKAYQVPKKAYGTFDPSSGAFVPQDESNVTRGTSCLVLPEGLRGTVKKIYNTNEWDRAHPILVKFEAGVDREGGGGFDIPKPFMMHLDSVEIEVLE